MRILLIWIFMLWESWWCVWFRWWVSSRCDGWWLLIWWFQFKFEEWVGVTVFGLLLLWCVSYLTEYYCWYNKLLLLLLLSWVCYRGWYWLDINNNSTINNDLWLFFLLWLMYITQYIIHIYYLLIILQYIIHHLLIIIYHQFR